MNEISRRGAAVAFLHVLQTTPDVYAEWMDLAKDDPAAVGALIQRTLGLAQAPDGDDLRAMALYIDERLQAQVAELQQSNPNAPRHVGLVFLMQQS